MKKITSLKWKIGKYLLTFGIFLIGMIFLFQIILLKPMYESYKVNSVKRISDSVAERIVELDDDDDMGVHMPHLVRTSFDEGMTMKEADRCCGCGGSFNLFHYDYSRKIGQRKRDNGGTSSNLYRIEVI